VCVCVCARVRAQCLPSYQNASEPPHAHNPLDMS